MADQANGLLSPWLRLRRIHAARPYWRGRILDFGCGIGSLAAYVAPGAYTGMDLDAESLATARQKHPLCRFVSSWPEGEHFDTIVALAVIEHLADPVDFFKKAARALAPLGRIVLTTPKPSVEWFHTAGARIGVFSRQASEDHDHLVNRDAISTMALAAGLRLALFRYFLFGANQLAVLERGA